MAKRILKFAFIFLCGLGIFWFCLPLLHGGFALGSVFGISVCGMGIALVLGYRRLAGAGGVKKLLVRVFALLYAVGLGWVGFLTGLMISYQAAPPPDNLNVIVLGAQVFSAERMGASLRGRVDKAVEYLEHNPQVSCIVTGGQGGNEPCPEALTQKNALTRMGIAPNRIYMEDKSRNTRQNLENAMELAQERGLDTRVVIVTQSFHLYRAVSLARSAGFEAYGLAADTDPVLFPQYYGRELLSLTKWWAEELFLH